MLRYVLWYASEMDISSGKLSNLMRKICDFFGVRGMIFNLKNSRSNISCFLSRNVFILSIAKVSEDFRVSPSWVEVKAAAAGTTTEGRLLLTNDGAITISWWLGRWI